MSHNRGADNTPCELAQVVRATCCDTFKCSLLLVAVLAFAGCAATAPRSPPAPPPVKPPSTVRTPAAAARVAPPGPRSQELDKNQNKPAPAKSSRDSLPASEVGYYMDVLQGRLKQLVGKNMAVDRQGERIVLELSFQLVFESASAKTKPNIHEILMPLSQALVEYQMTSIVIQARADDPSDQSNNPRLAEQRALAVAHYLTSTGVAAERIVIAGAGAENPPATLVNPESSAHLELRIDPVVRSANDER